MARYQHLNQMQQQRPCFPIPPSDVFLLLDGLVKTKTSLITSVGGAKQWSNYIKYDSE